MDMSLPVLDGWEATRRLKQCDQTKAIPVLALTAHAMAGERDRALEAGCNDYDTKPVDFTRLLGKIESLIPDRQYDRIRIESPPKMDNPIASINFPKNSTISAHR